MFCSQCSTESQPSAHFCHKCGAALSGAPAQAPASVSAIWNPNAAANWSLIFTPAFGAYLQMLNWRTLGETEKASSSRNWFYVSLAMLAVYPLMGVFNGVFGKAPETINDIVRGLGSLFLLVWYFSSGRVQAKYVKEKLEGNYQKKSWGKALFIGFGIIICYFIATVMVGFVSSALR